MVTSEIEGGNAASIVRVADGHVAIAPREDAISPAVQATGPISSYVVCAEIMNEAPTKRTLTIDVLIPQWMLGGPKGRFDYYLRRPYLLRDPQKLEWTEVPSGAQQSELPDRVRLALEFAPGERKILSTIPSFPFSALRGELDTIVRSAPDARLKEIGRSEEGRAIWSLEMGADDRPVLVFSATAQPGEPSAWAILAMARATATDPEIRRLRQRFKLLFLPMPNPDGVYNGYANTNPRGKMIFLGFEAAARNEETVHEAKLIWDYLGRNPPVAIVEIHFLSLPNHKVTGPYVIDPVLFTQPARRAFAESLAEGLTSLAGPKGVRRVRAGHPMWKDLLIYQAMVNWNTAAFLYQNTGPSTSYGQSEVRGVEILNVTLRTAAKVGDETLFLPARAVQRD